MAKKLFEIELEYLNFETNIEILILIMVYQWPLNLEILVLNMVYQWPLNLELSNNDIDGIPVAIKSGIK